MNQGRILHVQTLTKTLICVFFFFFFMHKRTSLKISTMINFHSSEIKENQGDYTVKPIKSYTEGSKDDDIRHST